MPLPLVASGALLAGGQALGIGADLSAARRRNSILTQGSREQNRAGMESAGVMGDFLTQLRGSRADPAPERAAFTGALGSPGVTGPITGSSRFRNDAATATTGAQGYGRNLAELFARIRAPQQQRRSESELLVEMGNAQRPIQQRAQDEDFLTQLRAGNVQSNPWQKLAGMGLSNIGSYYMGQKP